MPSPCIVVIAGKPATGKTTLALRLARDLALPLIYKDAIKEALFDALGAGDRVWSRRLGVASYGVMWSLAETLLSAGQSLILESNFSAERLDPSFARAAERFGAIFAQLHLHCAPTVLVERFERRAGSVDRHPGHFEVEYADEFRAGLTSGDDEPLPLPGPLLRIDTTRFELVDYETALQFARLSLSGARQQAEPS
jgi:predicted kinase